MKFRDLAPDIQPELPGCPLFQCDKAARDAAIQFFSKVDLWRAEPEMLTIVPGNTTYDLSAPAGAEPSRVMEVTNKGVPLTKVASESDIYSLLDRTQGGIPTHFYQRDNEAIIVAPAPSEAAQFRVFLSLKPSATGTAIPDGVGKEYRKLLSIGAKGHCMIMAGVPWSNPQQGAAYLQLFERGISQAQRRVQFGFNGAPLTVQKRKFI